MSAFRLAFHMASGRRMVEVWDGEQLIAAIYPGDGREFKIVSKFGMSYASDEGFTVPATIVTIGKA